MKLAGFDMRSWNSNNLQFVNLCQKDGVSAEHGSNIEKVLGYKFDLDNDSMSLNEYKISEHASTKRQILSEISKIYDPLSLFSPVTVKARCLMQEIWLKGTAWDQKVPLKCQNGLISNLISKMCKNLGFHAKVQTPHSLICLLPFSAMLARRLTHLLHILSLIKSLI